KFINDRNWRAPKSKKSVPSNIRIEQLAFIAETYLVYRAVDIPKLFYQQFGIHKTYQQIKSLIDRNGIRLGRSWHSKPGGVLKASSSTFKKDRLPHNHLPIGRFRVTNTGFPQYTARNLPVISVWHHLNTKTPSIHSRLGNWPRHIGRAESTSVLYSASRCLCVFVSNSVRDHHSEASSHTHGIYRAT
ncbi:hypothetical protein HWQ48_26385, partial [Shewanella sp. E94]|uniref:hypothetical protein n=1 Tax=Shewanella sp. E94 TaxID=2746933 RepID=UPI002DD6845B